jgi:hypothetical protein
VLNKALFDAGPIDTGNATVSLEGQGADDVTSSGDPIGVRSDTSSLIKDDARVNSSLKERQHDVSAVDNDLHEESNELLATDDRLKSALAEVGRLSSELDGNAELLNECQVCMVFLRMKFCLLYLNYTQVRILYFIVL